MTDPRFHRDRDLMQHHHHRHWTRLRSGACISIPSKRRPALEHVCRQARQAIYDPFCLSLRDQVGHLQPTVAATWGCFFPSTFFSFLPLIDGPISRKGAGISVPCSTKVCHLYDGGLCISRGPSLNQSRSWPVPDMFLWVIYGTGRIGCHPCPRREVPGSR
ncbi:hypothetical protein GGR52DRAFT_117150 [Hypoxylon sp. FL1284]|nr:hypothetical protein GGR52DRAFT_117150 [Hypoxylon sp. FL1284]